VLRLINEFMNDFSENKNMIGTKVKRFVRPGTPLGTEEN